MATRGHGSRKEHQEDAALAALLSEPSIEAAAKKVGIRTTTLYRWLDDPVFRSRYRAARRAVVESAIGGLQRAATQAVDALTRNLTCGTPAVEVGAAKAILDQAIKAVEVMELAARIEQLEQAQAATTQGPGR